LPLFPQTTPIAHCSSFISHYLPSSRFGGPGFTGAVFSFTENRKPGRCGKKRKRRFPGELPAYKKKAAAYRTEAAAYKKNATAYKKKAAAYKIKAMAYEKKAVAYKIKAVAYKIKAMAYEIKAMAYKIKAVAYEIKAAALGWCLMNICVEFVYFRVFFVYFVRPGRKSGFAAGKLL
jgi:hypothetical protein